MHGREFVYNSHLFDSVNRGSMMKKKNDPLFGGWVIAAVFKCRLQSFLVCKLFKESDHCGSNASHGVED